MPAASIPGFTETLKVKLLVCVADSQFVPSTVLGARFTGYAKFPVPGAVLVPFGCPALKPTPKDVVCPPADAETVWLCGVRSISTPPVTFKLTVIVALTVPVVTRTWPVNVEFTVGEVGNAAGFTEIVTVTGVPIAIVLLPKYAVNHGTPAGVETDVETLRLALPLPLAITTGAELVFADPAFEFKMYIVTAEGTAVSPVTAAEALSGARKITRGSAPSSNFLEMINGSPYHKW